MQPPKPDVCRAFGVSGHGLGLLPGGQGRAWRDGGLVFKPVDNEAEHAWVADVFAGWDHDDVVRVPRPVRAANGSWVYDGWAAHEWVVGRDASMRTEADQIRSASEDFHALVSRLARPGFIDSRLDPWAFGDRVAWEDEPPEGEQPTIELLREIRDGFAPVAGGSQVVHGDIGGNVLVVADLPPAVIDFPPYFRPPGFALAVAATDAVCWTGLPLGFLDEWRDVPEWYQLTLRALAYRIGTTGRREALGESALTSSEHAARVRPALDSVLARL